LVPEKNWYFDSSSFQFAVSMNSPGSDSTGCYYSCGLVKLKYIIEINSELR